jgi:hypothetical protein
MLVINSLIWNGKEFINSDDHGRELQSASSFYSSIGSWAPECYNPTEAGSHNNGNTGCTDSRLLQQSAAGNVLFTKTQMAFYAAPSNGTQSCPTPVNTIVTSTHIMEKLVEIGLPNIPNAIKYQVNFSIPSNENNLGMGQFEVVTGYLKNEFNTIYHYNQFTQAIEYASNLSDGEYNKPIIMSTSNGSHAMGIYSPEIPRNAIWGQAYAQFQFPTQNTYKWSFVRRILNIQPNTTYSFTGYICVGSLEDVRVSLSQLLIAYPN